MQRQKGFRRFRDIGQFMRPLSGQFVRRVKEINAFGNPLDLAALGYAARSPDSRARIHSTTAILMAQPAPMLSVLANSP